ncbi:AlpA family phage regulatory protein [Stenotrophomonas sp. TWI700]|uniref:helix-turn-helix transcriptional regulator n=1 Tax=Stenotrophomonas sp. TWI700 TaxID=3136792 RepID=UPI00320A9140
MIDDPLLTFSDAIHRTGHDLASMSGIDLQSAGPTTVRAWEARGLALHHLTADMAEALKVTVAARSASRPSRTPAMIQPRAAAKTSNVQPLTAHRSPLTAHRSPLTARRLLRRAEVQDRVGLCKSTLYSRISVGTFPKPVTLGSSVRWVECEVEAWISERVSERDHANESGGTAGGTDPDSGAPPLAA